MIRMDSFQNFEKIDTNLSPDFCGLMRDEFFQPCRFTFELFATCRFEHVASNSQTEMKLSSIVTAQKKN